MTTEFERALLATLRRIERNTLLIEAHQLEIIMEQSAFKAALDEAVAGLTTFGENLTAVEGRLEKALAEILAAAKAAGNTTPEMDAALAALQSAISALSGKGAVLAATAEALDNINVDTP